MLAFSLRDTPCRRAFSRRGPLTRDKVVPLGPRLKCVAARPSQVRLLAAGRRSRVSPAGAGQGRLRVSRLRLVSVVGPGAGPLKSHKARPCRLVAPCLGALTAAPVRPARLPDRPCPLAAVRRPCEKSLDRAALFGVKSCGRQQVSLRPTVVAGRGAPQIPSRRPEPDGAQPARIGGQGPRLGFRPAGLVMGREFSLAARLALAR